MGRRQKASTLADGEHHRTDTKTYEKDQTRMARLRAAKVEYIRVRKAGFFDHPERTIDEIRAALASG